MNRRIGLALAGLLAASTTTAHADGEATAMAQAFCGLRTLEGGMGLMHLTSPALADAIRAALAENAKLQAAKPDEKPPLGDGVPWQSYQDVSDTCEAGPVTAEGEAFVAEINYGFAANAGANWTDRLVLVKSEAGALVVDDIRYGTDGTDTLRKTLVEAFGK